MAIFRGTGGQGDSTTDTTVTTVTQKAAEAASSATSAATSATAASNSATSAETSATNAATSESNAATSATASATSATASETAKTAAQAAQTAAETAETNAETAETNAETAQAAAEAAQAAAETAQTNAETAETNAETAETNAETAYANTLAIFGDAQDVQDAVDDAEKLAVNPEDSQYTLSDAVTTGYSALHYAAKAEDSAALSQAGKNDAQTASDAATVSSTLAATYASNASDSADDAAVSASQALSYKNAAENRYDLFNDRFLGQITGDPDTDNNGDPLVTGALYFNTIENEIRVYTGSAWEPIQELSGDQTVNSLTSNNDVVVKGNLEVQGTTITVDSATAQTIDLGDNDKIRLGDSDDLQIYHDGNHSYISDIGTGNLIIQGAHFLIQTPNAEKILQGLNNGAVSLYYDGSKKLDTTSTGVDVTGNITVSGTVDGRDVAADGTTLDAVASTYVDVSGDTMTGNLNFGDDVRIQLGNNNDLRLFHNGTRSFVQDSGAGSLVLDTNGDDVRITHSTNAEAMAVFTKNGSVLLKHDGSDKFETTSSGVDITGTVVADGLTVDGDATLQNSSGSVLLKLDGSTYPEIRMLEGDTTDANSRITNNGGQLTFQTLAEGGTTTNRFQINHTSGDVKFYEDTGTTAKLTWDASAEHLKFSDSVEARFGDNSEFRIYHDTSDTYLVNFTQGNIYLKQETNDKDVVIQSDDGSGGSTNYFVADGSTGEAKLFHYGSEKLATKSTGIDVTGTVTADGLTVDGDVLFDKTTSGANKVLINASSGNNSRLVFCEGALAGEKYNIGFNSSDASFNVYHQAGAANRLKLQSNGDIAFYDDSGTSQDFYWDASTSKLGLGTTTPSGIIHATSSGVSSFVFEGADVGEGTLFQIRNATNNSATGNGHRLEFVHGNNNSRNVFFRTSSTGTFGRSPELYIGSQNDSGGAELDHVRIRAGGDVSFYNDDSTSEDFYWDASTSRLGIGTTSPSVDLEVNGTAQATNVIATANSQATNFQASASIKIEANNPQFHIVESDGPTDENFNMRVSGGNFQIRKANDALNSFTNRLQIDGGTGDLVIFADDGTSQDFYWDASTSRLGLGTTSPSAPLQVHYTSAAPSTSAGDAGLVLRGSSTLRTLFGSDSASPYGGWIQNTNDAGTSTYPIYLNPQGGNVSIGTKNAGSHKFNITQGYDTSVIQRINGADETSEYLGFGIGASKALITAGNAGGGSTDLAFEVSSSGTESEAMRIDSSGRLGLGTTSPLSDIHIAKSAPIIRMQDTDNDSYAMIMYNTASGGLLLRSDHNQATGTTGSNIIFQTDASEAARIDSSGNLLVGTTNVLPGFGNTAEGISLRGGSHVLISRSTTSGNSALYVNKNTSDGALVNFSKDGTTVGSIGTSNSHIYIGTGDTGIRFTSGDDALLPINAGSGATRTDAIDLGRGYSKFKNLYLSGGVYLGGTGADNLLDDYEEGAWTPTATVNGFNQTISSLTGNYTKIGQSVTVTLKISLSAAGYASSYSQIGTLPFTPNVNSAGAYSSGTLSGNGRGDNAVVLSANTNLWLHEDTGTQTSGVWFATVTYFTAS